MNNPIPLTVCTLLLAVSNLSAATLYVALGSPNPTPPYTTWASAAANIQDAVDAALAGDLILVSNGVYQTGGRLTPGYFLTNRVLVTNPITVQSVNGPGVTVIQGRPATTNTSAIRCVYLTDGAVLTGFTLTNGATIGNSTYPQDSGGGVWCASSNTTVVSNCVLIGNSASWGGGAYQGTLTNCTLTGNSALYAGGAYYSILNNCTLTGNHGIYPSFGHGGGAYGCILNGCTLTANSSAGWGGGAYSGTLDHCTLISNSCAIYGGGGAEVATMNNCTLTGNSAIESGGGAFGCTLSNCTFTGNSARYGGGATLGPLTMNNCTVISNSAQYGGGVVSGTLNNCLLAGNTAQYGGGIYGDGGTLNNCTLSGNSATNSGGGAYNELMTNSIVFYNSAPTGANFDSAYSMLSYCCTTPMPTGGVGNISADPLFVDYAGGNLRLQTNSPCINAGDNAYVVGSTDLDGRPRIVGGTVDMGAYEFQGPGMSEFIAWLQQYGLPTDGSADYSDTDGNGMNNWQDWIAGLNPTNALSVLKMLAPAPSNNPPGLVVTWESVNTRTYYLQSSTNLAAQPAFSTIQSNIVGQASATSYTDTTARNTGPYFYRVGVGN
jgi:hypothetical protein